MNDEAETLRLANEKLREELVTLKQLVENLREKRSQTLHDNNEQEELSEENNWETLESELLTLENRLLRAQLQEQQDFLQGCRKLMQGIPELHSANFPPVGLFQLKNSSSREELLQQGAENALTQLLLFVSRSQLAADWKPVELPERCFQSCVPGLNVTCNYRKELTPNGDTSLCLRVDGCFPNISPEAVAQGYWSTWISAQSFADTFGEFFGGGSGKTPIPFVLKELMRSQPEDEAETRVNLYRENPGAEEKDQRDFIYCMTKVKREIAMSTLNMAAELNPSVASRRVQHTRKVVSNVSLPPPPRKRGKGCNSSSQLMGRTNCIVLARNSMKGVSAFPLANQPQDFLCEGLFVWQDEVSIDFEQPCNEGVEVVRKRVPAARASSFISFSNNLPFVQETEMYTAIMDASGKATEKYARLIDMFYLLMGLDNNNNNTVDKKE